MISATLRSRWGLAYPTFLIGILLVFLCFFVGAILGWKSESLPPPSKSAVLLQSWDPRPVEVSADLPYADLIKHGEEQQLLTVDALPPGEQLSRIDLAGLRAAMHTKLLPVARNNIANRLIAAVPPDPNLWKEFAAMHADTTEDPVWRDYSVQFLSLSIPLAEDKKAAGEALVKIAREDRGTIGTTALLHVAIRSGKGEIVRPSDFSHMISSRIEDPATPDAARHTAFALIGEENLIDLLPLARGELLSPRGDDAKRGALFALGKIGQGSDLALVQKYAKDPNAAVVLAATAAVNRLQQKGGG